MAPFLAAVALAEAPAPAMVTTVRGAVTLVEAGAKKPAPAPPFLLGPTQSLEVAAGAHVVLLRQGGAFTVDGPKTVDAEALRPTATAATDPVGDLLARRTSLASAGASRGAGLALTRPVPGSTAFAVPEVRWRCDACGPQKVGISALRTGETVWTGEGDGRVRVDPKLQPGPYEVQVGGHAFSFNVGNAMALAEQEARIAAMGRDTLKDPVDRASFAAAAWLLLGYPSEALRVVDAVPGAEAVVAEIEKQAGVAP